MYVHRTFCAHWERDSRTVVTKLIKMDTVTFFLTRNGSTLEKTIRRGQITSERLSLIFKVINLLYTNCD